MTTYSFPAITCNAMTVDYVSNTDIYQSPISGAIQSVDRGGERLLATMQFNNLVGEDRALMTAFVAKMNGHQHRVNLPYQAISNLGNYGGTPLVNGASQTGNSLIIDGASISITNWAREGDWFSVNGEMKIITADANSDGAGNVTLTFSPRLRSSPANNAAIETTTPTGVFLLLNHSVQWANRPGGFMDVSLSFVEDIAA